MRTRLHSPDSSHGIDLAPMLDFVVNLLIFFIITAVFVKESGVTVKRPEASTGTETPSKSIVIGDNGEISIEGKAIDLCAVRAHIEQFKAVDGGGIVIAAKQHAPTGVLVSVVDQVHIGGIEDITFTIAQ